MGTSGAHEITLLLVRGDDYNRVEIMRRWATPSKLADPASLPPDTSLGGAWSPNGEFLAIAHFTTPFVTIYQRSGTTFTKLADPASLPASTGHGAAWSPNGEFLAVAHGTTPFVTIYQTTATLPSEGRVVLRTLGDS